jgi:hypothetical protein
MASMLHKCAGAIMKNVRNAIQGPSRSVPQATTSVGPTFSGVSGVVGSDGFSSFPTTGSGPAGFTTASRVASLVPVVCGGGALAGAVAPAASANALRPPMVMVPISSRGMGLPRAR